MVPNQHTGPLPTCTKGHSDFRYSNGKRYCYTCHKGHSQRQQKQLRQKKAQILAERKVSGCARCGIKNPIVLEFHHIDPDTKDPMLKGEGRQKGSALGSMGVARMLRELDKCVVLCANCHKIADWEIAQGVSA